MLFRNWTWIYEKKIAFRILRQESIDLFLIITKLVQKSENFFDATQSCANNTIWANMALYRDLKKNSRKKFHTKIQNRDFPVGIFTTHFELEGIPIFGYVNTAGPCEDHLVLICHILTYFLIFDLKWPWISLIRTFFVKLEESDNEILKNF